VLSFRHEILVELFRGDGQLAVELLRTCAGITVDHAHVKLGSIDLSQVAPTEYRADAVVILHDRDDRPVTGVIVEVQRQIERSKRLTWPVYVTTLRAKLACAAVLLVVAPDPAVAAWARQPIEFRPQVLRPGPRQGSGRWPAICRACTRTHQARGAVR
jgi:hypothetical protein